MRPYLRVANVYENRIDTRDILEMNFTPAEAERFLLMPGDILLNEGQSRELVGRPAMFRDEVPGACFQNTLIRFRAHAGLVHPAYALSVFRYYLRAGLFQDVCKWTTNIAHLGAERFAAMPFPLAPKGEQERIGNSLDALLARVDACRGQLDRVPRILKRLRQATCAAAATGALTEDWRNEFSIGLSEWADMTVGAIAESVFDGPFGSHLKSSDYSDAGVRVVRLENIAPLSFIEEKRTYIPQEKFAQLRRHTLLANDVLFSSFVDQEVRVCLLPATLSGVAINKADCFCIRANRETCDPRFLAIRLATRSTFVELDDLIHGATRPRINLSQLKAIRLRLPPLKEQAEIVRRVESLFALADTIESRHSAASARVERLTPALLAKALRGELVPQDLNDEPVSEMLAGLHAPAGRNETPAIRKPGRRKAKREAKEAAA